MDGNVWVLPLAVAKPARTALESTTVAMALLVVPKSRPTLPSCTNSICEPAANGCITREGRRLFYGNAERGAAACAFANIATCSYIRAVTSTGIRELKDNLSRYIRRIEAGERI